MKFAQRKFWDTVELELGEEEFLYTIQTASKKKKFAVDYMEFDPTVLEEVEQANPWWRNLGIAWVAIGVVLTALRSAGADGLRISMWLSFGLASLLVYRIGRTAFSHHAIGRGGQVALIQDAKLDEILDELTGRRKTRLLQVYGEIDFDADPEREIAKFRWLEHEGVLSAEQALAKIGAVRAAIDGDQEDLALDVN